MKWIITHRARRHRNICCSPVAPGDQGHRGQELSHQAQELAVQEANRRSEKED